MYATASAPRLQAFSARETPSSGENTSNTTEEMTRETLKHVFSRKTFLMDYYKYINDQNEILLFIHHNNIKKTENKNLRSKIDSFGAKLNILNTRLYKVYLRNEKEQDPVLKVSTEKNREVIHSLSPLLAGPTGIISFPTSNPKNLEGVIKILKTFKEKAFVIGAKIENSTFDINQIDLIKDLPLKPELQSQLTGLLSVLGGAGLIQTLESTPKSLYLTMVSRETDLNPDKKNDD